jgi:hypothetical protein
MQDKKFKAGLAAKLPVADRQACTRRLYSAPKVLSAERLEAAAAICEETSLGGPGKDYLTTGTCSAPNS